MDLTRDPEPNEYRLAVTLAFTGSGIAVEAFVRLDLERGMGEWPAGVHTPYRRHAEGPGLRRGPGRRTVPETRRRGPAGPRQAVLTPEPRSM
ncbi:hypothetical protein STRTUCAR8_04967 [Streptomyces turgidiscabies Car8]|uniref:Uncharacterized protein n=1 Tax=Streptomyces turgidiscabies (strain Car8) TaxID=698760 RepID=L7FB89_STRT8|nr:hypothetical protein STRTUCAR8_04967 [Streptomyces turgidiscabies Car8]